MKLSIHHDTCYTYANQVCASIQFLRLTPQSNARQQIRAWQVRMPRQVRSQIDPYGNVLHVLTLEEPHSALALSASGQVEIDPTQEVEHDSQSPLPFLRTSRLTQADEALVDFAKHHCGSRRDRAALIALMDQLAERMPYSPGQPRSTVRRLKPSLRAWAYARIILMRFSPAPEAWVSRHATCRDTCAPRMPATWPATPGPRLGSGTAGTAST